MVPNSLATPPLIVRAIAVLDAKCVSMYAKLPEVRALADRVSIPDTVAVDVAVFQFQAWAKLALLMELLLEAASNDDIDTGVPV